MQVAPVHRPRWMELISDLNAWMHQRLVALTAGLPDCRTAHPACILLLIGVGLSLVTWVLLLVLYLREMTPAGFVPIGRWAVRFSVILVSSGELVKLRFVLIETTQHDYFFWLYVLYVVLQVRVLTSAANDHRRSQAGDDETRRCATQV